MSNIILWIFQIAMTIPFLYSGFCKSLFSEQRLVAIGQTGVEGLHPILIKFIGISEIAGVVGLIIPTGLHIATWLTPVAAGCLAFIMLLAARIHYRRNEPKNVFTNVIIFVICTLIACGRVFLN